MIISKFTLGESLVFLPNSVWSKNKDYVKSTRAISKLKGVSLINVGHIDISQVDPNEILDLNDKVLPSSELMILAKCPLESDDQTGVPTSWGNAIVRISIGEDYLHAALAIQPKPNGVFIIVRVMRLDQAGVFTSIFPEIGEGGRVDEIMSFDDMRRMVFGLVSKVLKNKLKPTNPEIIFDKRLKGMSKSEKASYIEYRIADETMMASEYEQRKQDLIEDTSSTTNRMSPSRLEEVNQTPKGTSTKLNLMKRIFVNDSLHPNRTLLAEARNLNESILFVDVSVKLSEFELAQHVTYQHLPFNDFMLFCNIETVDENTGELSLDVDGLVVRMKKIDDQTVRQFVYYRGSSVSANYTLLTICDLDVMTGMRKQIVPVKPTSNIDEFLVTVIPVIKHALHTILSFEPVVKNDPTGSFQIKKRVSLNHRDRYLEYTLDLNKSTVYNYGRKSMGGTHASPIEHERRGHWRTYKSGKRTWVDAITVNKGVGGRIEKDYKL